MNNRKNKSDKEEANKVMVLKLLHQFCKQTALKIFQ